MDEIAELRTQRASRPNVQSLETKPPPAAFDRESRPAEAAAIGAKKAAQSPVDASAPKCRVLPSRVADEPLSRLVRNASISATESEPTSRAPSRHDRYLREAVVHRIVFARLKSRRAATKVEVVQQLRPMRDTAGNLTDYSAPIVRNAEGGARAHNARAHNGALGDALAAVRPQGPQLRSGRHQRAQCRLAALAALARRREPMRRSVHKLCGKQILPDCSRPPVWLALDESRPLAFFAGVWTLWTSVRNVKGGRHDE